MGADFIPNRDSGIFSTLLENFPLPKKKKIFQNHMNWNILQRWKFFHFWWKIFHFGEILFSGSGPSRLPNLSPEMQSENFSTLVENFPLSKSCKKKFFLQNCMNWNILLRSKIFHFWWKIFHFGEILFSTSRPSRLPNFIPNG